MHVVGAVGAVVGEIIKTRVRNKRQRIKLWVRQWIKRRNMLGASKILIREFCTELKGFSQLFMLRGMFDSLLDMVSVMVS